MADKVYVKPHVRKVRSERVNWKEVEKLNHHIVITPSYIILKHNAREDFYIGSAHYDKLIEAIEESIRLQKEGRDEIRAIKI